MGASTSSCLLSDMSIRITGHDVILTGDIPVVELPCDVLSLGAGDTDRAQGWFSGREGEVG